MAILIDDSVDEWNTIWIIVGSRYEENKSVFSVLAIGKVKHSKTEIHG